MLDKRRATLIIAIINILAFIANILVGGGGFFGLLLSGGGYLKEWGEASLALITERGQWWRLLTCGYLHMGIVHLVGNLAALEIVGSKVEEKAGAIKLLLIYHLGTIMTAFLWCLIFRNGAMVGASLGIFVLLGIMCVLLWKGKRSVYLTLVEKRYLVIYVIVGCFLGIGTITVHAIGFAIGMLAGIVLSKTSLRGEMQ